ncbi:MAG: SIR2 family protein [Loktanella sp.]|nr:SIR2 family protein [Loktanella sp.]
MATERELPDAPALRRLSDALWARSGSGAAVLVGAGFSKQCERPEIAGASPPLWSDLAQAMARGLGRSPEEMTNDDPLRLAETYETVFGRAALVRLVRHEVNDQAWRSGDAHSVLLDLPWTDVLTTNYDTLLERAASGSARGYGIVRREGDLSGLLAPRIIKLHGTIEDDTDLVITEEDYRRYPDVHAAMVNTARQALIENDLCLLGFSGNDPNFRAWVGWVRDRLRGLNRRVFIVGPLDLDPIDRSVLERLSVIPIDLSPIVSENAADKHKAAIDWFLARLADQAPPTPSDWKPLSSAQFRHPSNSKEQDRIKNDRGLLADNLRGVLKGWREDRVTYPGWIVCPWDKRERMRFGTDAPVRLGEAIDVLKPDEATDVLLELAWRYDVASDLLPPWLAERLDQVAPTLTSSANHELVRATVAARMLAARATDDLEQAIKIWSHLGDVPEVAATIAYARLSDGIDRLDVEQVSESINEITADDPIWLLRRASAHAWLCDEEKARDLIADAWSDLLDRCRRQPFSIALRSRLAWARLVSNACRNLGDEEKVELPHRFRIDRYDPWDELRHCDTEAEEAERKFREQPKIDIQFRAGTYREPQTIHFGSPVTPADELAWLRERVGLPYGMHRINLLRTRTERAILASENCALSGVSRALAAGPNEKGPLLGRWLTRIGIAALDEDTCRQLMKRCECMIEHLLCLMTDQSRLVATDRIQIFVEVLARLAVRGHVEDAERHARLAGRLARVKQWHLVSKQADHLMENAILTLSQKERWRILPEVIDYPIPGERNDQHRDLSNHHAALVEPADRPEGLANRVADLLSMMPSEDSRRAEAVHLLLVLHKLGVLLPDEVIRFSDGLWNNVPEGELPGKTTLYPDVFMKAPAPDGIDVEARLRSHLYDGDLIANAEFIRHALEPITGPLPPDTALALKMFDHIAAWRPTPLPEQDPMERMLSGRAMEREWEQKRREVSAAFGNLCWHLGEADRTSDRADALTSFTRDVGSEKALIGGLAFSDRPDLVTSLRRLASTGAFSQTSSFSRALTIAVHREREIPRELIDATLTATAFQPPAAIHVLLRLVETLVEAEKLTSADMAGLEPVLDDLWTRLDYTTLGVLEASSHSLISAPFARANAVRLASALSRKGVTGDMITQWRDCAAFDPLPEVRYSAAD